jgi:hypothetical protein
MLKNKVWGLAIAAMLFASCKEQGPAINFEDVVADPSDTTYITTSIPAAQPRNVLLEEFTGVSCPNCPDGHVIVNSIKNGPTGNRLVAIGLYQEGLGLTDPVHEGATVYTVDDFRTPISNSINGAIYGGVANSLPIAGVDRAKFGAEMLRGRGSWAADVTSRMNVATPVNLEVTSTYNDVDSTLKVKITSTFTSAVNKNVYLIAGIVQDSIVDYQEDGLDVIPDYLHNHVLRGLITPQGENGLQLEGGALQEAGRVRIQTLNFKLTDLAKNNANLKMQYVKPEHCRVFVYLFYKDGTSSEVLQACEVHMK